MKKKILTLGVIILLVSLSVILTGCENNSKEKNEISTETNEQISKETGIEITKVTERFSGGVAIVEDGNERQYGIDENGKVICENEVTEYLDSASKANGDTMYASNGYITLNSKDKGNYIYDSKGKEIAHSENKKYGKVSKSGYINVIAMNEDVSGQSYVAQIEDLEGNKISETYKSFGPTAGSPEITYLFEDFFEIYDRETEEYLLINAKTKELKKMTDVIDGFDTKYVKTLEYVDTYDNWYSVKNESNDYWFIKKDFSKVVEGTQYYEDYKYACNTIVLDKYLIGHGEQGGNSEQTKAFDFDGNMVKDFSDIGGIKVMQVYNNVIYVITDTGYIYTMDENFDYISEPIKTEYTNLLKTEDGIWGANGSNINNSQINLLDDKLQTKKEISVKTDNLSEMTGDGEKWIYKTVNEVTSFVYNVEKEEILQIYK